jgi:hypothetical protein
MLNQEDLLDLQFIEVRHQLLDVAAFLDRIERAEGAGDDFRLKALQEALPVLLESYSGRAQRILELLSDRSSEPIPHSSVQGALGAPTPACDSNTVSH